MNLLLFCNKKVLFETNKKINVENIGFKYQNKIELQIKP